MKNNEFREVLSMIDERIEEYQRKYVDSVSIGDKEFNELMFAREEMFKLKMAIIDKMV